MEKQGKPWYAHVSTWIVIFISLLGIATSSLLFLLIPQSSEIVRLMQWRMVNVENFYVETDLRWLGWKISKNENGVIRKSREAIALDAAGWVDSADDADLRMRQKFTLVVGEQKPVRVAGEYVKAGEASYLNFGTLPSRVGALHLDEMAGRWLRIDVRRLFADVDLPAVGGGRPPLEEADRAFLREQFRITPFVRVKEKLKNEKLGGVTVHHYQIEPEILFFKDYFVLAETKRLGRELTNKERIAADTFFANLKSEDGELWIGSGDYLLRRLRLRFLFDDGVREGTLSLTMNFSRYNEPLDIEAPTKDIQDATPVVESLLPSFKEHLPLAKDGAARRGPKDGEQGGLGVGGFDIGQEDPDEDGLTNALENFYGADPNNPDTDADGVKDGAEIDQGRNPAGPGKLFDFFGGQFD
jgi:hypothetical protein